MDSTIGERWLAKLAKLRVAWAKGDPAPHKPLLLLAIIELAEQASLPASARKGQEPILPF